MPGPSRRALQRQGARYRVRPGAGTRARSPPVPAGSAAGIRAAAGRAPRRPRPCRSPRRPRRPGSTARPGRRRTSRRSARRTAMSSRSRPCSSTSNSSRPIRATSPVTAPSWRTSATSRTRRSRRLATRGVPRGAPAISAAPSASVRTAEDAGRAQHDRRELLPGVVVEPRREPEPLAQRQRDQPRAGRRGDQREPRQVQPDRARGRALAEHDVERCSPRAPDTAPPRRRAASGGSRRRTARRPPRGS